MDARRQPNLSADNRKIADPLIGLAITLVILKITWDSWRIVTTTEPGEPTEHHTH